MDNFSADLERITAGDYASHYIDDDEFNYAVDQMENLGHDRTRAAEALGKWIDETPMWDCAACGHQHIDEDGFPSCPICGATNPSVVWVDLGAHS